MIGQGECLDAQPGGLRDQLLRVAGAVEEAEGRVDVQLGPVRGAGDGDGCGTGTDGGRVARPCGRAAAQRDDLAALRARPAAGQASVQFAPGSVG